jgi:hypothetical protein
MTSSFSLRGVEYNVHEFTSNEATNVENLNVAIDINAQPIDITVIEEVVMNQSSETVASDPILVVVSLP